MGNKTYRVRDLSSVTASQANTTGNRSLMAALKDTDGNLSEWVEVLDHRRAFWPFNKVAAATYDRAVICSTDADDQWVEITLDFPHTILGNGCDVTLDFELPDWVRWAKK